MRERSLELCGEVLAMGKKKSIHEGVVKCPYCKKESVVRFKKEVTSPAVKAEYHIWVEIEKNKQKKLQF